MSLRLVMEMEFVLGRQAKSFHEMLFDCGECGKNAEANSVMQPWDANTANTGANPVLRIAAMLSIPEESSLFRLFARSGK